MTSLMVNLSTLLIIAACAVVISLSVPMKWRWAIILPVLLLSLVPVAGGSLWLWISGAVGELSIVTALILLVFILRKLTSRSFLTTSSRVQLYYLILLAGFMLYPASLGLSMFDPYALGFGSELSLFLLVLSSTYWVLKYHQVAVVLLLVVAAETASILASTNTWDYFIDPLLWLSTPVLLIILKLEHRRAVSV